MIQQVAVIGAGISGLNAAFFLNAAGMHVDLYEKQNDGFENAASYYAGGMLAPFSELIDGDAVITALGEKSVPILREKILPKLSPIDHDFNGSLLVAYGRDQVELDDAVKHLEHYPKQGFYQPCDKAQIEALEPSLAQRFQKGIFIKDEGYVDPRALMVAMLEHLQSQQHFNYLSGVEVDEIIPDQDGASIKGKSYDWVIDCRGMGAQTEQSELRGIKGEMIIVQSNEVELNRPIRFMHPRFPLYIVPRENGHFMIGATMLEKQERFSVSVRSALELLSALYALDPRFGEASIVEMNADLRPAYPDHHPYITLQGRVISINGMARHGYLLAPLLGEAVQEFVSKNSWTDAVASIVKSA